MALYGRISLFWLCFYKMRRNVAVLGVVVENRKFLGFNNLRGKYETLIVIFVIVCQPIHLPHCGLPLLRK